MSAFYVWEPSFVPDLEDILQFTITNGDIDVAGKDDAWMEGITKACGKTK